MHMKGNIHFNSTIVSGLPENVKLCNGNFMANKQIEQLSSREIEVLQFTARGKLNKPAASELCISVKTVEKHRNKLMKKLVIHGIAGLSDFAISVGIIQCNPRIVMA